MSWLTRWAVGFSSNLVVSVTVKLEECPPKIVGCFALQVFFKKVVLPFFVPWFPARRQT